MLYCIPFSQGVFWPLTTKKGKKDRARWRRKRKRGTEKPCNLLRRNIPEWKESDLCLFLIGSGCSAWLKGMKIRRFRKNKHTSTWTYEHINTATGCHWLLADCLLCFTDCPPSTKKSRTHTHVQRDVVPPIIHMHARAC